MSTREEIARARARLEERKSRWEEERRSEAAAAAAAAAATEEAAARSPVRKAFSPGPRACWAPKKKRVQYIRPEFSSARATEILERAQLACPDACGAVRRMASGQPMFWSREDELVVYDGMPLVQAGRVAVIVPQARERVAMCATFPIGCTIGDMRRDMAEAMWTPPESMFAFAFCGEGGIVPIDQVETTRIIERGDLRAIFFIEDNSQ
jgi:hypothetical protein